MSKIQVDYYKLIPDVCPTLWCQNKKADVFFDGEDDFFEQFFYGS